MSTTEAEGPGRDPSKDDPESDAAALATRAYFIACRERIDPFVHGRFGLRGTLELHRAALGLDLLRAPANVLLAPVHVLVSLVALGTGRLGLPRLSAWLRRRDVLLRTDTGGAVERLIAIEVLGLPPLGTPPVTPPVTPPDAPPRSPSTNDGDTLADAMLSMPPLETFSRRLDDPGERAALGRALARSVRDYAGTRGAVAEVTVALGTLCAGVALFRTFTHGLVSMAPSVAGALTRDAAVSRFAFGETLGTVWYGAFPPHVPGWLITATLLCLVPIGAVFAAFAGILADPLQVRLGIHRRRLLRLVDALEADVSGALSDGFAAREHYYARLFDVVDAGSSVLRIFRG